LINYLWHLLSR